MISVLSKAISAAIGILLASCLGQLKWHWFWKPSEPRPILHFEAYNAASTSPWGSLMLLCRPKLWLVNLFSRGSVDSAHFSRHFPSVGATLMIAVLAIDPFLQQMPTYLLRLETDKVAASVGIANVYRDVIVNTAGGEIDQDAYYMLSTEAQGAVYGGLYNASSAMTVQPSCSSGNCTWAPYSTLGFCSTCKNVSTALTVSVNEADFDGTGYGWTASNGMSIDSNLYAMSVDTSVPTMSFAGLQNYSIVDFTSLYYDFVGDLLMDESPPNAWECILYFCVQQHNSSVRSGAFQEQRMEVFPNSSTPSELTSLALTMPADVHKPDSDTQANPTASHPAGSVPDEGRCTATTTS